MSSLSHEDFERLQTSLIELKNQNYVLEENFRKQRNALGEATARATVMEQELTKAQKVIQKSKKVTEVQSLVRDNESMQRKLISQEEDFRIQNQTLLDELSKLVSANERLESTIRSLQSNDNDKINGNSSSGNPGTSVEIETKLRAEISSLKIKLSDVAEERETLSRENERLQNLIIDAKRDNSKDESSAADVVEVSDGGGVVFRRHSSANYTIETSNDSQMNIRRLKGEVSKLSEENSMFKAENRNFQEQLSQVQEKLKKKQESFLQIQEEKENVFNDLSKQLDELRASKESELVQLRDQVNRLQIQLNHGHSGFSEFKEKKAVEIRGLQNEIQKLKEQNVNCSQQKQSELSAQVICLSDELSGVKNHLSEISQEKENLILEVTSLKSKLDLVSAENVELNNTLKDIQEKLDAANKTSDKRKLLLDEMAIRVQTKTDESNSAILKLEEELAKKKSEYEELELELNEFKSTSETLSEKLAQLEIRTRDLEKVKTGLESELQSLRDESEKKLNDLIDSHLHETKIAKSESEIRIRDLTMQLEIANAQKSEFEEEVNHLHQEIQDLGEERKISEKKSLALSKDLKRQLLSEQLKNEKLSEKMKELLSDPPSFSEPERRSEIEPDRTSNSSWSIYSGHNDLPRDPNSSSTPIQRRSKSKNNSNDSLSQLQMPQSDVSSPANTPPILNTGYSEDDYRAMLSKIGKLQEENVLMQQRLQMLEHSSAAMADDLLNKSKLIQHYCMEGKSAPRQSISSITSSNNLLPNEKLKKMVDLLVHPNNDSQKEEFQRMQNMLEETLTKNMYLQKDLEHLSQEVVRLSKITNSS